jgi:hypothetical protein
MTGRARPRPGVDLYLFPAVVGGGLGDIEEVLLAGRRLAPRVGRPVLFRRPGRPLPRSVDGPFEWPPLRRRSAPAGTAPRAVTLSAWWGVSAAPAREGPLGRGGPWSEECAAVEAAYGRGNVLHVSFEEFARTLTSRAQTVERWREGGVPLRTIRARLRRRGTRAEIAEFHDAFRRFRAFDRPDVLHLYPSFLPARAFRREFPEAVPCGPFWPAPVRPPPPPRAGRWVWYASPGSSDRLAAGIARHWDPAAPPVTIEVRAPVPFDLPEVPGLHWERVPPEPARSWRRRLASAEMRVVTGSRTLLEAIADGGPFLYFNGVLGSGLSTRRHRPEKIVSLLALWRRRGVPELYRDGLASFSNARGLARVLRAARTAAWRTGFPRGLRPAGFPAPYDDAEALLASTVRRFAMGGRTAEEVVADVRSGALREPGALPSSWV